MGTFESELMRRSPLAGCVLELSGHVFDGPLLAQVYEQNRGRCYQDTLTFCDFLTMMRDALTRHGGSAHKLFLEMEDRKTNPVDESNFYRKLARTPVGVSRALLHKGAARLGELMPGPTTILPICFDAFAVVVGDGKKIKNATHRLAPTRGFTGSLIGAKALVAIDARTGLAIAMSDSLDGMTNDCPLVPDLMKQLAQIVVDRPILSVWDRQFGQPKTMRQMMIRANDRFVVRVKDNYKFTATSQVQTLDVQGRIVIDEAGLSDGRTALNLAAPTRRLTLRRTGEQDIIIVTNLTDPALYPAVDLLQLYAHRWGIEQIFQQVTQTFCLQRLIGSSPKAVLLQFAYCLMLYNMMQVIRAWVAQESQVLATAVSMHYLFDHTRRQLQAWAYHTNGNWSYPAARTSQAMRDRLAALLKGVWNARLFSKAPDKKPRIKPKPKGRLHGGHSSVQRLIDRTAKVILI